MSEHKLSLPAPVHVREYPPFALAMGMSFLSWLFGSIALDSLWGPNKDIFIGILFAVLFLGALTAALVSWTDIVCLRRIGLYMNASGVTRVQSSVLYTNTHSLTWEQVTGIKADKNALVFATGENSLRVMTSGLLENPDWILERAKTWLETTKNKNKKNETTGRLDRLQTELEAVVCRGCGGSMEIQSGALEKVKCGFCGETQGLSATVKDALKRLSVLISELPAAHRQFQEDTLRRFVETGAGGGKYRRNLLGTGWGTAGIWLSFALVEVISSTADKGAESINTPFVGVVTGLAVFSVLTVYLLIFFIRRAASVFSLPMSALGPVTPGGGARCRLCGAGLPETGVLRRCEYCRTDSVVTGGQLAAAERSARDTIQQAQKAVHESTETAGRLLENVAGKLQWFAYTQFFWLHIPIVVALDGSTGMLARVTGLFLAMLIGTLASAYLGMRWLSDKTHP